MESGDEEKRWNRRLEGGYNDILTEDWIRDRPWLLRASTSSEDKDEARLVGVYYNHVLRLREEVQRKNAHIVGVAMEESSKFRAPQIARIAELIQDLKTGPLEEGLLRGMRSFARRNATGLSSLNLREEFFDDVSVRGFFPGERPYGCTQPHVVLSRRFPPDFGQQKDGGIAFLRESQGAMLIGASMFQIRRHFLWLEEITTEMRGNGYMEAFNVHWNAVLHAWTNLLCALSRSLYLLDTATKETIVHYQTRRVALEGRVPLETRRVALEGRVTPETVSWLWSMENRNFVDSWRGRDIHEDLSSRWRHFGYIR